MFLVSFLVFGVRSTLFGGWLQNFQSKIDKYEEKQKMEFLSTLEELGIEKGQQIGKQIGAKENSDKIFKTYSNGFFIIARNSGRNSE